MKERLLRAALAQYESTALTARENLDIYLSNPCAVAEHPDVVGEVTKLTQEITDAEENIRTIEEMLITSQPIGIEQ